MLQLRNFELCAHALVHDADTLDHVQFFQQVLFLLGLQVKGAGQEVGQQTWRIDVPYGQPQRFSLLATQVEQFRRGIPQAFNRGLELFVLFGRCGHGEHFDLGADERVGQDHLANRDALQSLHHQDDLVLFTPEQFHHGRRHTNVMQVVRGWVVLTGVLLSEYANDLRAGQRFLQQLPRRGPANGERQHDAREEHRVTHRQNRQRVRDRGRFGRLRRRLDPALNWRLAGGVGRGLSHNHVRLRG